MRRTYSGTNRAFRRDRQRAGRFAGDVIPLISNVSPAWISAYDVEPLCSYEEKSRLLELAAQENLRIIYCHDAYFVRHR